MSEETIVTPADSSRRKRIFTQWRLLTSGLTHRRVLMAAATIAMFTALARFVGLAKELLVARRFGTGPTIEAYLIALVIPMLATNVISSSLSVSLIPTFVAIREKKGKEAAQELLSGITIWTILLLLLITLLIIAPARLYLPFIASGFNEKKLELTFALLIALAPIVVLNGIGNIWGAVINAGERFALVALTPAVTPAVTIIVLLIVRHTIFALPLGMVIGAALEMILLGIALKARGVSLRPRWRRFDSQLRQVASQFGHRVGASSLRSGSVVVDRSLAAMLAPGNVAALNYGSRITMTILSVAGIALGSAVTPYYANIAAKKDWEGLRRLLKRYVILVLLLSVPVTALLYFFAGPIVRLIYERGSFRPRDTQIVAQVHAFYALQVPFYLGTVLIGRFLGSLLASHLLVWAAVINVSLNILLDILLIKPLGVSGLALASGCASLITFCFLSYVSLKEVNARMLG